VVPFPASRAARITLLVRGCLVVLTISICVLVFGPFSGDEASFGLTDKEAHVLAFYVLTALGLAGLPNLRKWDVALMCVAVGGLIEVIQPFVGRDGNIADWVADSLGVGLCIAPMLMGSLRALMRQSHDPEAPQRRAGDQLGRAGVELANKA
jgi:VanZ family protein